MAEPTITLEVAPEVGRKFRRRSVPLAVTGVAYWVAMLFASSLSGVLIGVAAIVVSVAVYDIVDRRLVRCRLVADGDGMSFTPSWGTARLAWADLETLSAGTSAFSYRNPFRWPVLQANRPTPPGRRRRQPKNLNPTLRYELSDPALIGFLALAQRSGTPIATLSIANWAMLGASKTDPMLLADGTSFGVARVADGYEPRCNGRAIGPVMSLHPARDALTVAISAQLARLITQP